MAAIVTAVQFWRGAEGFDNLFYDRLGAAARTAPDGEILIVAVDDRSLAQLGQWPWDRTLHAKLVEKLHGYSPRSITLDILLSEPGTPAADATLGAAIAKSPAPVIVPLHFDSPGSDGLAYDHVLPIAKIARVAKIGHANILFDPDGIVRRTTLCFHVEGSSRRWPHLMELVYRTGRQAPSPSYADGCERALLIPYARRGSFTEISYVELLLGEVPASLVRGRDIIIGATAVGLSDNFPTPNGEDGLLSGVEIMANMLGAIRRDDFIAPVTTAGSLLFSLLPLALLMSAFLIWAPRTILAVSLLLLLAIPAASGLLLFNGLWVGPGAALLGILLVYPLWGWRRLQATSDFMERELRSLENEFDADPLPIRAPEPSDLVHRQSEQLSGAILKMRDLRRFVSDTLADLPDPMFVTNPSGIVTLTNERLDENVRQPIMGALLSGALNELVAPEQRALVEQYLDGASHEECVRFASPHGRTFVMRRSDVRSDSGDLHGHIHYLADISELARAEAEREEVLQLLSHDMRAPQSTIIAILDGEIDADAKRRIGHNARRTMQLAQDFVEMARMAETPFEGEDLLLADLLREVADSMWPLAKERGAIVAIDDRSKDAFVRGERELLVRAFSNLIDNAIRFSPDGGKIEVGLVRSGSLIEVSVRDHGPGIAAEILPCLFERFVAGNAQQGRVRGTGLGLNFVHVVAERHHGTVCAGNVDGGGARFVFSLPEAPVAD